MAYQFDATANEIIPKYDLNKYFSAKTVYALKKLLNHIMDLFRAKKLFRATEMFFGHSFGRKLLFRAFFIYGEFV